ENKAGAGGSIGMAEVARATDGLTFGVATLSTHGVNPAVLGKLPYDPIKDFVGVTEIVKAPGIIVVNPKVLPVKDFADLVKHLKAHPGKVEYATPGNGTIGHMWGELFKSATGTSMVHIPYRGAGPATNDVLGGQVPVYFDQVASSLPHVKAGKLKALAVSWHERLAVLPDVPTYAELGYKQANDASWFGLVAPKSTPAAQVQRVQQAVAQALKEPAVRDRLAAQGLYASGTTPAEFSAQIAREIDKMKQVAAYAKIKLD
ncbi:MAG: tripartite tricarboxylate transporter substrate-binding protein, partial [Acidovorax sp.]|nr:tripartite tricarboxylate transporter substrate-binding protein [Acidovorax sp.]